MTVGLPGGLAPAATFKEHVWVTSWESDGSSLCSVCGVSENPVIRVDMEDRGGVHRRGRRVRGRVVSPRKEPF
jgi:hypothetical protein